MASFFKASRGVSRLFLENKACCMEIDVETRLSKVKTKDAEAGVTCLRKILENVLLHPNDDKYSSILNRH